MASQFSPNPAPGQAPLGPRPTSPRGLYRQFGMPESLLRIHFPNRDPNQNPQTANPWYWYFDRQQPYAFSFIKTRWFRFPAFGIIKILPIDTQELVPIPLVGFTSVENAIKSPKSQPDVNWGRIDFRDDRFWGLIQNNGAQNKKGPKEKPKFDQINGQIRARDSKTNINGIIKQAAQLFETDWRGDAGAYNAAAAGVAPSGFHYSHVHGLFSVGQPSGPPTTIAKFAQELNAFVETPHGPWPNAAYLSALPPSACFNINTFTTDATAYTLKVGQLDPKKWNMSVFPPLDSTIIGNGSSSQISQDYDGFGRTPFPLGNPSN